MKQNVQLQGVIFPEKLQLDKIKSGRLAAIIDFSTVYGRV